MNRSKTKGSLTVVNHQTSSWRQISEVTESENTPVALLRPGSLKKLTWVVMRIVVLAACIVPSEISHALTLAWDAVQDPSVAGYRLYYGVNSGVYTQKTDVGGATTASVSDLIGGLSYYFAVTAYDTNGYESGFSSEIQYTAPATGSAPLVQLTYPANGATYVAPANISMAASVIDSSQTITTVQFFNGTELLGASSTPPYSFTWTGAGAGTYNLSAVAIDLLGNEITSQSITVIVTDPASTSTTSSYLTGEQLRTLRNGFDGFLGMQIVVGSAPVSVTALGRMMVDGNSQTHIVKLVNATDGSDVPGGAVSIGMAGGSAGQFQYADLSTPVVLAAGGAYYLVSQETAGGDFWYYRDTTITTTSVATELSPAWGDPDGSWHLNGRAGQSFGPLDFKYATATTPPSVNPPPINPPTSTPTTTPPVSVPPTTPPTTPPPTINPVQFVTSTTTGISRNGFSGFAGMQIVVGASPITVTALGRMMANGNTDTHLVKLVYAGDGTDVPGGAVSISMAGATVGQFQYSSLSAPIVLSTGTAYYLVSQESAGGDFWFYDDTTITTTSAASEISAVWTDGSGVWHLNGGAGQSFGPVDFQYISN
jgi:hypothetical protein